MKRPLSLVTPRLVLREYVPQDLGALMSYQADPRAREFYGPDEGRPLQVLQLLRTFLSWAAEEPRRDWQLAVALRDRPATPIGSAGLRRVGTPPGHAEMGLELAPDAWGRGYATEAAGALLDFGFGALGLDRVHGESVSANERVARLLRRLGFRSLGTRPGPEWMAERGWSFDRWELRAGEWARRSAPVSSAT